MDKSKRSIRSQKWHNKWSYQAKFRTKTPETKRTKIIVLQKSNSQLNNRDIRYQKIQGLKNSKFIRPSLQNYHSLTKLSYTTYLSRKVGSKNLRPTQLKYPAYIRDQFTQLSKQNFSEQEKIGAYQKMARLGQNQEPLQTAISLLQSSQNNIHLVVRWKMQLAAMRSSSEQYVCYPSHNGSFKLAFQVMTTISQILEELRDSLKKNSSDLSFFIDLVLRVIRSDKRNDIIWVHNFQNNMKCFTDHIRQLTISSQSDKDQIQTEDNQSQSVFPVDNFRINPFYPGYDFQIADYMSLQKLPIDYIKKFRQTSEIKQKIKQLAIYASICLFTQSTESYYMRDYSLKYLHFKAIQVALLTVDRECTFIGFLLKILNDYYGSKMSQIRQENSEIMEGNQLKRRIPRDKRQAKMSTLCFAE